MEWRLDYGVRSLTEGRVNAPRFLVTFKVRDTDTIRDIQFSCSLQEMQELVGKLRDANKQVERLMTTLE